MQADLFSGIMNINKMATKNQQGLQAKTAPVNQGGDENGKSDFIQILNQLSNACPSDCIEDDQLKQALKKVIKGEDADAYLAELLPMLRQGEINIEDKANEGGLERLLFMLKRISGEFNTAVSDDKESTLLNGVQSSENISIDSTKEGVVEISDETNVPASSIKEIPLIESDGLEESEKVVSSDNATDKNIMNSNMNSNQTVPDGRASFLNSEFIKKNDGLKVPIEIPVEKAQDETIASKDSDIEKQEKISIPGEVLKKANEGNKELFGNIDDFEHKKDSKNHKNDTAFQFDLGDTKDGNLDEKKFPESAGEIKKTASSNKLDMVKHENESRLSKEYLKDISTIEDNKELSQKLNGSEVKSSLDSFGLDNGDDAIERIGSEKNTPQVMSTKTTIRPDQTRQTDIIRQVVEHAKISNRKENSEVMIKLKPEVLGNIRLNISTENHHVTIKIVADSVSTKNILEHNLHHLKDGFVNQGLEIGSFDVMVGDDPQDLYRGQNFSGFQRGRRQMSNQKKSIWNALEEDTEIVSGLQKQNGGLNDRIDYYA